MKRLKFKVGDCVHIVKLIAGPGNELPDGLEVGDVGYVIRNVEKMMPTDYEWEVKFPLHGGKKTLFYARELELVTTETAHETR